MKRGNLKFIIIYSLICILESCKTVKDVYPEVYGYTFWEGFYHIVFLREPNTFIESSSVENGSVAGEWSLHKDTIICIPKVIYHNDGKGLEAEILSLNDTSIYTVPMIFIKKNNGIENITDYSDYYKKENEWFIENYGTDFYKYEFTPSFYKKMK